MFIRSFLYSFLFTVYHMILNIISCVVPQDLVVYLSKYTCLHLLNPRIIFLSSVYNIADEIVSNVVILMTAWSEMHLQKLYFKNKTQYQCGKTMKTIRVNCVILNHDLLLLYKSISLPTFHLVFLLEGQNIFKSLDGSKDFVFYQEWRFIDVLGFYF